MPAPDAPPTAAAARRRLIPVLIFGLVGTAILVALGIWQVQRLAWKEGVIAELEARLSAAPVDLPEAPTEARDEYLRVSVPGATGAGELHVLTSEKPWGPGFRVIAPFVTADGRRLLIDRGYVPEERKEADRAPYEGRVTGALLWPDETDGFTPAPDRDANIWFARDAELMAEALDAEPVMLVAETATGEGEFPVPRPVTVNVPDDHLEYAVTWFSLAAIWVAMTLAAARRIRRRGRL